MNGREEETLIGRLTFTARGKGTTTPGRLYGLNVLWAEVDPESFWAARRLRKAGQGFRRAGVSRLLVPGGFASWGIVGAMGLRPIETEPLVQAQGAPLALGSLERQGLAPDRATVALRGSRADRAVRQAAVELCPQVRNLVIDVPRGGRELAQWLRWEFGMPVLPREMPGQVGLCFHPDSQEEDEVNLGLYGPSPKLAGLSLSAPELAEEDRENLPLLAALWEGGRLGPEDIKILDRTGVNTYNDTESILMPTES